MKERHAMLNTPTHRLATALLRTCALGALCGAVAANALAQDAPKASATGPKTGFVFGPYKHVKTAINPETLAISTNVTGTMLGLAEAPHIILLPETVAVTLAYAFGKCGQETWDGLDAAEVAAANMADFDHARVGYIIATGGEGKAFSCSSDAGMEQFIARYDSPGLVGFDFDIGAGQSPQEVRSLLQRTRAAQVRRPDLRFSFTLATLGASDASQASLTPHSLQVLEAIRAAGLKKYYINLRVMNADKATPAVCVVRDGRCDMAASAAQAARNLNARHGVPLAQIEVTAMIGVNGVGGTQAAFTPTDAIALAGTVKREKLGGLHYWSLDRDGPCPDGASTGVSPTCSGLQMHPALSFSRAFVWGLQ